MDYFHNTMKTFYNFVFTDLADPRTNGWFLISDPILPLSIVIMYLFFVLKWGPNYMKHRKPFGFTRTLIAYNFLQIILSLYLFQAALFEAWLYRYSWKCQPVDVSNSPHALKMARIVYAYFLVKMFDLLDTIFFVLRKKNSHISFLHVYHHAGMAAISWGCTKYFPGGHGTFVGLINCLVHSIMYFYYLMAALGPQYQKYLWWKKYITTIQMIQFCLIFLHNMQLLFYDCGFPKWTIIFTLPNAIFFYYLFYDFYNRAYVVDEKKMDANERMVEDQESSEVVNCDVKKIS